MLKMRDQLKYPKLLIELAKEQEYLKLAVIYYEIDKKEIALKKIIAEESANLAKYMIVEDLLKLNLKIQVPDLKKSRDCFLVIFTDALLCKKYYLSIFNQAEPHYNFTKNFDLTAFEKCPKLWQTLIAGNEVKIAKKLLSKVYDQELFKTLQRNVANICEATATSILLDELNECQRKPRRNKMKFFNEIGSPQNKNYKCSIM